MKKLLVLPILALLFLLGCEKDQTTAPLTEGQSETVILRGNAGNAVKPFKGFYKGFSIDEPGCSVINGIQPVHFFFNGNATHVGKSTWEACQYNTGTGEFTEEGYPIVEVLESYSTFTAANGDQFTGYYTGEGYVNLDDGNVYFWGDFTITSEGNTGRFECVTGTLPYYGQTHPDGNFFYIEDGFLDFTNDDC